MGQRSTPQPKQPGKTVSLVSPQVHLAKVVRELVRRVGWHVLETVPDIESAKFQISEQPGTILLLDEPADFPVHVLARKLMNDPAMILAPTIVLVTDQAGADQQYLRWLGRPEVLAKPLTPAKINHHCEQLVKRWDSEPWTTLSAAHLMALQGDYVACIRKLVPLADLPGMGSYVAIAVGAALRLLSRRKDAEAFMLKAFKRNSKDAGVMSALGDLYLASAMPHIAHRFFAGARDLHPNSIGPIIDLAQTCILSNELPAAIGHLEEVSRVGFSPAVAPMLCRLYLALGREADAERVLSGNRGLARKALTQWVAAENPEFEKAS